MHAQCAVSLALRFVKDPVGNSIMAVFTVEQVRFPDDALLQCGGYQKRLEGGPRIETVGDGFVFTGRGVDRGEAVGVEAKLVGQRENLARAGIHDNRESPLSALVFDCCLQVGFHHVLDAAVDGQEEVIILLPNGFGSLHTGVKTLPLGVSGPDQFFRGAFQIAVVAQLEPFQAGGIQTDEADQVAGQFAAGIVPFGLLDDENPVDVQFLNKISLFRGDSPREPTKILCAGQFLPKNRFVCLEEGGQTSGNLAGMVDFRWIGADGIDHDGRGQLFAVAVKDDPPFRLQRKGLCMLLLGEGLEVLPGEDLQLKSARREGNEQHQEEHQQGDDSEPHPFSGFTGHFSMITCCLSGYVICSFSRAIVSIRCGDFNVASSTFSFLCSSSICSWLLSSRAIRYSNSVIWMWLHTYRRATAIKTVAMKIHVEYLIRPETSSCG